MVKVSQISLLEDVERFWSLLAPHDILQGVLRDGESPFTRLTSYTACWTRLVQVVGGAGGVPCDAGPGGAALGLAQGVGWPKLWPGPMGWTGHEN